MSGYLASDARVSDAYIALRSRVVDLVRSRRDSDGDLPVPHCPAWTARDLLAHLVGAPEDILAGRLEGVATDAWTHAQVERHRGNDAVEVALGWVLHNADLASPGLAAQLLSYRLDAFDLLRVCTGRRSRAQILDLGLDVGVVELLLAKSPLSLPETAVRE